MDWIREEAGWLKKGGTRWDGGEKLAGQLQGVQGCSCTNSSVGPEFKIDTRIRRYEWVCTVLIIDYPTTYILTV